MNINLRTAGLIAAILLSSTAIASAQAANTERADKRTQHATSQTTKHVMHTNKHRGAAGMNARAQQADPNASPMYRPGL